MVNNERPNTQYHIGYNVPFMEKPRSIKTMMKWSQARGKCRIR
jgi:hypothetical protein